MNIKFAGTNIAIIDEKDKKIRVLRVLLNVETRLTIRQEANRHKFEIIYNNANKLKRNFLHSFPDYTDNLHLLDNSLFSYGEEIAFVKHSTKTITPFNNITITPTTERHLKYAAKYLNYTLRTIK